MGMYLCSFASKENYRDDLSEELHVTQIGQVLSILPRVFDVDCALVKKLPSEFIRRTGITEIAGLNNVLQMDD